MENTIKKLYPDNWNYNAAVILQELEKIVLNNGGRLCSTWKQEKRGLCEIISRGILDRKKELEKDIERCERFKMTEAARGYAAELEKISKIKNDPIITAYADYHYICFVYDGHYYYLQLDRNPFFDFLFTKSMMIDENTTTQNVYSCNFTKCWLWDCFFSLDCSNDDRREAANIIFNELVTAKSSDPYYTKDRKNEKTLYFFDEV